MGWLAEATVAQLRLAVRWNILPPAEFELVRLAGGVLNSRWGVDLFL